MNEWRERRVQEIGYFNPSLAKFFVRTSSPFTSSPPPSPPDQLATLSSSPMFLGVKELIRVPYFSRLQRLSNINRRKRRQEFLPSKSVPSLRKDLIAEYENSSMQFLSCHRGFLKKYNRPDLNSLTLYF